jgi:hypothetical protein
MREKFSSVQEAPSHLLADGTLVYLPPPTVRERSFSFAECVARHRLLESSDWDVDKDDQDSIVNANANLHEDSAVGNVGSAVGGNVGSSGSDDEKNRRQQQQQQQRNETMIHPLAMASARLQTNGISELTKVINLSSLVQAGEYMGYAHVMNHPVDAVDGVGGTTTNVPLQTTAAIPSGGNGGGNGGGGGVQTTTFTFGVAMDGTNNNVVAKTGSQSYDSNHTGKAATAITLTNTAAAVVTSMDTTSSHLLVGQGGDGQECHLRAQHVLDHKRRQYESATCTFQIHRKRLRVLTAVQKVLDRRYLELRQRWKLSAPKHASVVLAPLRPDETIAIDVNVYNSFRDRQQYQQQSQQQQQQRKVNETFSDIGGGASGGKIAQMVPRYATIELANTFHVQQVLSILRGKALNKLDDSCCDLQWTIAKPLNHSGLLASSSLDDLSQHAKQKKGRKEKQGEQQQQQQQQQQQEDELEEEEEEEDASVGVPQLTLVFEVEKSVTGFVHSVALSSVVGEKFMVDKESIDKNVDTNATVVDGNIVKDNNRPSRDEQSIQALQHSLFCAHVFDSIKREVMNITREERHSSSKQASTMMKMQQGSRVAWLSSETEDNFLPPPSLMAGGLDITSGAPQERAFGTSPLSVIHCHEGEVKVQLNSEYALTVRLVDVQNSREFKRKSREATYNCDCDDNGLGSGSQSREQIDILCRLLLLHAQFVFHEHHKRSLAIEEDEMKSSDISKRVDYSAGMMGQKQNAPKNVWSNAKRIERYTSPPNILQSCVALGSKVLFERHVRRVLKVRYLRCRNICIVLQLTYVSIQIVDLLLTDNALDNTASYHRMWHCGKTKTFHGCILSSSGFLFQCLILIVNLQFHSMIPLSSMSIYLETS